MKIALVTNQECHHLYWIYKMYKHFDVRLIIIPGAVKFGSRFLNLRNKNLFYYGNFWFLLKLMSIFYNFLSPNSFYKELKRKENQLFGEYSLKFQEIPKDIIEFVASVNDTNVINKIKACEIDVICFLGGDIARNEVINASRIATLNFHAGLSPFYNGNKTTFHSVSDFRPNLSGGTLMYMNNKIDGGAILSHYLPEINEDSTAVDLFLNNIKGAFELYKDFLDYISINQKPEGIFQERSLRYFRNIDWTIVNDVKLNRVYKYRIMKRYKRSSQIVKYYGFMEQDMKILFGTIYDFILKKNAN